MNDQADRPQFLLDRLVREIRSSRKYRTLALPEETLRDLLHQESGKHRSDAEVLQAVREKLHNIVAPYLGDPDYAGAAGDLTRAFKSNDLDLIKTVCVKILDSHSSTRERIPLLNQFYERIWAVTGIPETVLDLACGLQPFGLPWMGLPQRTQYYAFDLHGPRIELINHFFHLCGRQPLGFVQDVLVNPPQIQADAAFFFKEAHRFEQRRKGCNRSFFESLNVRWLLVSLPAMDLRGHHSLVERQRMLMNSILVGSGWPVEELLIENEMIFCIRKS